MDGLGGGGEGRGISRLLFHSLLLFSSLCSGSHTPGSAHSAPPRRTISFVRKRVQGLSVIFFLYLSSMQSTYPKDVNRGLNQSINPSAAKSKSKGESHPEFCAQRNDELEGLFHVRERVRRGLSGFSFVFDFHVVHISFGVQDVKRDLNQLIKSVKKQLPPPRCPLAATGPRGRVPLSKGQIVMAVPDSYDISEVRGRGGEL